ncbi:MAG: TGS domain-containing protein [Calothrix sp. MO_192.B10]|nr:TGS domain-containing protein [Calothrix sp. MO_192.B10]
MIDHSKKSTNTIDNEQESEDSKVYTIALERLNSLFENCTFLDKTPEIQKKYVVDKIYDLTQDANLSFAGLLYLLLSNHDIKDNQNIYNLDSGITELDSDTKNLIKILKNLSNILSLFSLKKKNINKIDDCLSKSHKNSLDDSDLNRVINLDDTTDVEKIIMMIFVTMSEEKDIRALVIELVCRLSFLKNIKPCKYWHNQSTDVPLKTNEKLTFKIYVAFETFKIFVPIANRLGIWSIKWELEDLSFKQLQRDIYSQIATLLNQEHKEREDDMKYYVSKLEKMIIEDGSITNEQFSVSGRTKNIYSIYAKMKQLYSYENNIENSKISFQELEKILKQDSDTFKRLFEGVHDLFGVRVICDSQETCYQILSIIRDKLKRKSTLLRKYGEVADYIERPKSNGYQSIHLVVHAPEPEDESAEGNRKLEVQIRTDKMHKEAEYGVAAHWKYKELGYSNSTVQEDYVFNVLKEFIDKNGVHAAQDLLRNKIDTAPLIFLYNWYRHKIYKVVDNNYLDSFSNWLQDWLQKKVRKYPQTKNDIDKHQGIKHLLYWLTSLINYFNNKRVDFGSKIYVFTPNKNIISLKKDSTPVDFAYRIHTDIGNQCGGARVNGRIVPLSTPLQNGDIVEIITQKNSHPNLDWLNFVRTSLAKNRIKHWYKRSHKEENIARGRELLEKEFGKTGLDNLLKSDAMQTVAEKCNYQSVEDLLAALGHGEKTTNQVVNLMQEQLKKEAKEHGWNILERVLVSNKIKLRRQSDYLLELAQRLNFQTTDDFLAALGDSDRGIAEQKIILNEVPIILQEILTNKVFIEEFITKDKTRNQIKTVDKQNHIKGIEGIKHHIAGCCQPIPGEKIVGITTQGHRKGHRISIHHEKCKNVQNLLSSNRCLKNLDWNVEVTHNKTYPVSLKIIAINRIGMMRDITSYLAEQRINISELQVKTYKANNIAVINLSIDVTDIQQFEKCKESIKKIKDLKEVRRISEIKEDGE